MTVRFPALFVIPVACAALACTGDPEPRASADSVRPAAPTDSAPVATTDATSQGRCPVTLITGDSIGPVRIGATVDELRARCEVVRDTVLPGPEGQPSRTVDVLMGADTVSTEIVEGRVWRIPVTSSRFRTQDGIGVGTPIGRLLELEGVSAAMGEGLYAMSPEHCGLSFQLDNQAGALPPAQTLEELRKLPESTAVSRVLVLGCRLGAR